MAELNLEAERIDSRDIRNRVEELTALQEDLAAARTELEEYLQAADEDEDEADPDMEATLRKAVDEARELFGPDEEAELATLEEVDTEGEQIIGDWEHGETLIREDKFKEYAQELAEDIGAIDSNAAWPNNCIDWEKAARELRMDYNEIEIDGTTYLGRA